MVHSGRECWQRWLQGEELLGGIALPPPSFVVSGAEFGTKKESNNRLYSQKRFVQMPQLQCSSGV